MSKLINIISEETYDKVLEDVFNNIIEKSEEILKKLDIDSSAFDYDFYAKDICYIFIKEDKVKNYEQLECFFSEFYAEFGDLIKDFEYEAKEASCGLYGATFILNI